MEARRSWLENASSLLSDLKQKRANVSKMFPQREYMKPLSQLNTYFQTKVAEFFTRDPAHLIPFQDLVLCAKKAKELGIEKENYQLGEIINTINRGKQLQTRLQEYTRNSSKTYAEAKYFYAEHINLGVKFHETTLIRSLIDPNIALEKMLIKPIDRQGLIQLQKFLSEKTNIDPELAHTVLEMCQNYETLDLMLGSVLNRTSLDFNDLADLEEVDRHLRSQKLQLPKASQFADLFGAYSWTIKASMECGIKATNLSHAINQLKPLLERRFEENPQEIIKALSPITNVQYAVTPIREFVEWSKILLWRANAKIAFTEEEVDLATFEELVTVVPKHIEHHNEAFCEYTVIEAALSKAKNWKKTCQEFMQSIDGLFDITSPVALTTKLGYLVKQLNYLRSTFIKEDLKLIKNTNQNYDQLLQSEAVIGAIGNICKMLKGELIDVNDFLITAEIISRNFNDDKKYSVLMHQYLKIQREILPSLNQLKKISQALQQQSITPKGMKVNEILEKQHLKMKVFDLDFHLENLANKVKLEELGKSISRHLSSFFEWEKEAKNLMTQNSIKSLLGFTTKEQVSLLVKRSKELKRNIQSSNLYSEILPELICYCWSLTVVHFLKIQAVDYQEVKRLIATYPSLPVSIENQETKILFPKYVKNLLGLLKEQVATAVKIKQFCEAVKQARPLHSDVEGLKDQLKTFKINMGEKLKFVQDLIIQDEKIQEKVVKFLEKKKPRIEVVEAMIETLTKEPIIFKEVLRKLVKRVRNMKWLAQQANRIVKGEVPEVGKVVIKKSKGPNGTLVATKADKEYTRKELLQYYRKINICSMEFEKTMREKELDESLVAKYQNILNASLPKFKEIEAIEMEMEVVENIDWVTKAKKALFVKKVNILRDSFEEKIDVAIDTHDLKTLARDGFHLSEDQTLAKDVRFVEDLLKKVDKNLKLIVAETPADKIRKLKKRLFNCIDITKEVNDLKEKLKIKATAEACKANKQSVLVKREKEQDSKPSEEEVAKKKKQLLKEKLKDGEPKFKRTGRALGDAIFKENAFTINVPEFSKSAPFGDRTNTAFNPMDIQKTSEPQNLGGIWGIYEGNLKVELPHKSETISEVQLLTQANWRRINSFPKLPVCPAVRDTISHSELSNLINTSNGLIGSESTRILSGVVSCSGLSRLSLNSILVGNTSNTQTNSGSFYKIEYGKNTTLVFIPKILFDQSWFSAIDISEQVKIGSHDFIFLIITKESNPSLSIKPFIAHHTGSSLLDLQLLKESKENQNGISQDGWKERRTTAKISDLLHKKDTQIATALQTAQAKQQHFSGNYPLDQGSGKESQIEQRNQ